MQAGVFDFAGQREHFGALAFFRADAGEPFRAFAVNRRDVGKRFDIVEQRRAAEQPALRRERRARTRRAALAFDGRHQRGFLAANKRAGTDAHVHVEIERRFKNARAEQAQLLGLLDGDLQPRNRQRIFRAHVNKSLVRADRVSRDGHAFEHAVRIAFQNAAVHERAGIAFVGVANDIFFRAGRFGDRAPFETGGKTRAAASAQTALHHRLDHVLRRHFMQRLVQGLVAIRRDVAFDALGIHDAAVREHDGKLFRKKRRIRDRPGERSSCRL